MTDQLDSLIEDYLTGMLEMKLVNRRMLLVRDIAKMEEEVILLSDFSYQKLNQEKEILDGLMQVIDGLLIKQIIIARFKYHLTWVSVGKRVCVEESTARKQYIKFKKVLKKLLNEIEFYN